MYSVVRSEISPVVSTVDQSKDSYRNANWCMHALSIEFDLLYVRRRYHRLTATLLLCRRVLGMIEASARRSLYPFEFIIIEKKKNIKLNKHRLTYR